MIDPIERRAWHKTYLSEGRKVMGNTAEVRAWAKSMSLIAEQFFDGDDDEPAEPALA